MRLFGGIYFNENGLSNSVRAMHLQTAMLDNINCNITNFGKVGYQRKAPVLSSFAELIGVHALSEVADESVGRLRQSRKPLDIALATEGYFQYMTPNGIKLTRDGRFKIDKNGYLLTLDNFKVLSATGQPIKFDKVPEKLEDIKVDKDGTLTAFDSKEKKFNNVGQLSVVSSDGSITKDINVKQGFTEDSNVTMHTEFFNLVPVRRYFEANRQLYIIQNDELSKTIQELGRA